MTLVCWMCDFLFFEKGNVAESCSGTFQHNVVFCRDRGEKLGRPHRTAAASSMAEFGVYV